MCHADDLNLTLDMWHFCHVALKADLIAVAAAEMK
jgi:hypothetical protein